MARPPRRSRGITARAGPPFPASLLALLALALQLIVPPGFMPARTNDLPFAVVICSAAGGIVVAPGEAMPGEDPADRDGSGGGGACQMAAQAVSALPAPDLSDWARPAFFNLPAPSATPSIVRPGRGLSGPPLPARGPPTLTA